MGIENIRNLKSGRPKEKKVYQIPKISAKKQEKLIEEKEGTAELWDWFEDRRREMSGTCMRFRS